MFTNMVNHLLAQQIVVVGVVHMVVVNKGVLPEALQQHLMQLGGSRCWRCVVIILVTAVGQERHDDCADDVQQLSDNE